jgi:hypothetical protein
MSSQALITGVDPQLGPLQNNGGPTQTMLPSDTSPLIDQGKAASGLTADQRGDPRTVDNGKSKPPGGDGTDIGAVELAKIVQQGNNNGQTGPAAPTIAATVGPANGITMSQATLHGTVTTNGLGVTWHFEYGRNTSYGQKTPSQAIYHYRLVAVSSSGQTVASRDATFRTPAPTIKVRPGAVLAGHRVRVFGNTAGCPRGDQVTLISGAFSPRQKFAGKSAIHTKVGAASRYSVITRIPAKRARGCGCWCRRGPSRVSRDRAPSRCT